MFNLQGSEIIVILLLALVVLGPEKLPDAIRRFSRTYAELKKMGNGFQSELKSALDEPMREMRETANAVRDAADPKKIEAQADAERRLADETSDDDSWIDAPHLQSPDEHSNGADATSATNASRHAAIIIVAAASTPTSITGGSTVPATRLARASSYAPS